MMSLTTERREAIRQLGEMIPPTIEAAIIQAGESRGAIRDLLTALEAAERRIGELERIVQLAGQLAEESTLWHHSTAKAIREAVAALAAKGEAIVRND